jgi:Domain of unknown function (DUF4440)
VTVSDDCMVYELRRRKALLDGDADALRELLHSRCVYVHASGMLESGEKYVERMATSGSPYIDLVTEDERVTVFDQVRVVTARQRARMRIAGEVRDTQTVCTMVWLSVPSEDTTAGAWKLIASHNAEVAPR